MKCAHCGYVVPDDSEFCPYCGAKIELSSAPTETPHSRQEKTESIVEERDRITQSQRYFDLDYGYSNENPIVVSSVPVIGYYLASLRTEDDRAFTWERQPRKQDSVVDEYQLLLDGEPYKSVFFRTGGNDTEYLPQGLTKNEDAYEAAKAGISLDSLLEQRAEKEKALAKKKASTKRLIRAAIIIVIAALLGVGAYYGYTYGYPYLRYNGAIKNIESNPEKAIATFSDLGQYESSVLLCQWSHYYQMKTLVEQEEYEAAIKEYGYFSTQSAAILLRDFSSPNGEIKLNAKVAAADAISMLETCYTAGAKESIQKGDYSAALSQLKKVRMEKASELYAECYYNLLVKDCELSNWSEAEKFLDELERTGRKSQYDLTEYEYNIRYNYAESCVSMGSEFNADVGLGVLDKLIAQYGSSDELLDLQGRLQEAKKAAIYKVATSALEYGNYSDAIAKFTSLDNYEDSATQRLEAMYQYVQHTLAPRYRLSLPGDNYWTYAKELSDKNYKDSRQFYNDLTAWHITTIMNNDPDDDETQLNSVSKYDECCVHVIATGGAPGETVRLKYVFTMSDGGSVSGKWEFEFYNGTSACAWCYYEQPQYAPTGTCKVRIYNTSNGKLLAEDSIRITG